jgi:hypothetical protein
MVHAFCQSINRLRDVFRRRSVCPPPAPPDVACPLTTPTAVLPEWVAADPLVQKYRALLGDLPWSQFPERPAQRPWPGPDPEPRAPFVAAFLVKLHEGKRSMRDLRTFLIEHPALYYWLGMRRRADATAPHGFDLAASVPSHHRFSTVLRTLPPTMLAFLLTATVQRLRDTLPPEARATFGDTIAGDTQALLAWVKENNPKQVIKDGRLDKTRQPTGDPDCKLGVKTRHNVSPTATADATTPPVDALDAPAPTTDGHPASAKLQVGSDIFWGYASGIVVTRLPDKTEIVLAERTRPFNESDISHFPPLMAQVEARLGRRPRIGIWDTAFDAHYVYDYFDRDGGQAVVPFNTGPNGRDRPFAADGTPLCAAGLPMTLQFTYQHRSDLVPHTREKFRCPLLFPQATGAPCPSNDPHVATGGCTTTIAQGRGSRLRHQLDRESAAFTTLFHQRTMVERINSQAEALGILHPKLRRGRAIANQNSLIYVLINLRALARLRAVRGGPPLPR